MLTDQVLEIAQSGPNNGYLQLWNDNNQPVQRWTFSSPSQPPINTCVSCKIQHGISTANALSAQKIAMSAHIKVDAQHANQVTPSILKDFARILYHVKQAFTGTIEMMAVQTVLVFTAIVLNASNQTMLMFLNHTVLS